MTMTRQKTWRMGAMMWALGVLFLPLQLVVALQWPTGYSLTGSAISDLGVTICGTFTDGDAPARVVCSPWHPVFNVGLVALGVLTTLGAILLYGRWNARSGKAGIAFAGVSGIFVVLAGLAPWDVAPDVHDLAALCQALLQWAAMILLAVAAGAGRFRTLTFACVVVSIAGFIGFLLALDGTEFSLLPLGVAERVAFDSLTLWTAAVGVAVLVDSGSPIASDPVGATPLPIPYEKNPDA